MTTATEQRTWQDLVSEYLDEDHRPYLRMSAAGRCVRALTYSDGGAPESDPADVHGENRMAMGHMAEVLIVRNLHLSGWETRHTALSPGGPAGAHAGAAGNGAQAHGAPRRHMPPPRVHQGTLGHPRVQVHERPEGTGGPGHGRGPCVPPLHGPDRPLRPEAPRDGGGQPPRAGRVRHDGPGRQAHAPGEGVLGTGERGRKH